MLRTCHKCGQEKEISEFVKNKTCKYGYTYRCKNCAHEMNAKNSLKRSKKHIFTTRIGINITRGFGSARKQAITDMSKENIFYNDKIEKQLREFYEETIENAFENNKT